MLCYTVSLDNSFHSFPDNTDGTNRARAVRHKGLSQKVTNLHCRHRSSVRRSMPKASRNDLTRPCVSPWTMVETSTTTRLGRNDENSEGRKGIGFYNLVQGIDSERKPGWLDTNKAENILPLEEQNELFEQWAHVESNDGVLGGLVIFIPKRELN